MTKLHSWKSVCAVFLFCALATITLHAQTFNSLFAFDGTDGGGPRAGALVQGPDGNYYGTTAVDGAFGGGTIFRITPNGHLKTLYNFCSQATCADGSTPLGALLLAPNNQLYGTTSRGGAYGVGTVFSLTSTGALKTIYSFCPGGGYCLDGALPIGGLVLAKDGNFYGATEFGGQTGGGTVFRITPQGAEVSIYDFCVQGTCLDGNQPNGVALGPDGNLYGTTLFGGGPFLAGTAFKVTLQGVETTLHSFCSLTNCTDGDLSQAGMVSGPDGNMYGVTSFGGQFGGGTVFQVTPDGTFTTTYNFCSQTNCADGTDPAAAMIVGSDGNFYGTTESDMIHCSQNCGTIFQLTPQWTLTTLHTFCLESGCADGWEPQSALLQATNGNFYGLTLEGGKNSGTCADTGCGTVFNLTTGLGPFVRLVRNFGKAGQTGGILGQGLTGTTSVALNGTPASFTVVSDTLIRATVPPGATSGYVTVQTTTGTLTSNVPFQVIP